MAFHLEAKMVRLQLQFKDQELVTLVLHNLMDNLLIRPKIQTSNFKPTTSVLLIIIVFEPSLQCMGYTYFVIISFQVAFQGETLKLTQQ